MKEYLVYIFASKKNGTLYTGFTDDIERRVKEHKNKVNKGFTEKYNVNKLVYLEKCLTIEDAKLKEKRMKKWNREWKVNLIERNNPEWRDLSLDFKKKLDNIDIIKILSGNKQN